MNEVSIITDGKKITGWTQLNVRRTMSELCDSFNFDYSDRWSNDFPLYTGLPCQIQIDGIPITTGFIDEIEPEVNDSSMSFMLSGRSKTMDLVDCNRVQAPYSWRNQNIYNLVKSICDPHGIKVTIERANPGEPFTEASVDQNESLFDFIQKLVKQRQLLTISGTDGNLILTNAGNTKSVDSFIEGENISSIKGKFSWANRYSEYVIKGQQKVKASADSWGGKTIAIYSKAIDENVLRFRPKMFTGNTQLTTGAAQLQVNWEAQVRAGRSNRFSIIHPSWVQSNGDLWKENLITYVKHSKLKLDGEFLIESVDYTQENNTQYSTIYFVMPDTYAIDPKDIVVKKPVKSGKYGWNK